VPFVFVRAAWAIVAAMTVAGKLPLVDNSRIADRLDAFASLLELVEANPYSARAYRRAADTIRVAAVPVVELVRSGRVQRLRGIGAGIEARLRELIETGEIAELAELEREVSPGLVGLGRYLGLGTKPSVALARSLGVRTADEVRQAAAEGRLRTVPGIGPKTEARRNSSMRPPARAIRDRSREFCSAAAGSSSEASRPRSTGRRRATCAGGVIPASCWQLSAPRRIQSLCWRASWRCPRSSR
jgi:hypothetical protein